MSKEGGDGFRVFVRIRPLRSTETSPRGLTSLRSSGQELWIQDPKQSKDTYFAFHGVFPDSTRTAAVYGEVVAPLVTSVLQGFNATCFAYGMTGAGKTHTMFGDMYLPQAREPGVVPLALNDLFAFAREKPGACKVRISYLEIYNEQVRDLLAARPSSRSQGLLLIEDPDKGVYAADLIEYEVGSAAEVGKLVVEGNSRRTMAPTGANQFSTRSHAVLQVSVERNDSEVDGQVTSSKLCLIDLAGSERAAATENRGVRMFEGANINRSLLALGNCINILSDPDKTGKFVPYRDSKLTRLLKDALGGNTKTVMLACVSPAFSAYEETLHTLKYAERAGRIKLSATRNFKETQIHVSEYKSIIASLKAEIETLKQQIQCKETAPPGLPLPIKTPQPRGDNDNLGQELLRNFEEFWELKQSLQEVETLNAENKRQIKALLGNLELVETINDVTEENRLKAKIKKIHENIRENEAAHGELVQSLQLNLKAKSRLQRELSSLQDDRQKDILQLEITVRTLKMEKMDLYIQNQEMKQRVEDTQKQSDEKERVIMALRLEMEEMKKQMIGSRSEPVSEEPSMKCDVPQEEWSMSKIQQSPTKPESKPPRVLKISDLNQARALRKSESQKAVNRSQSTDGFLTAFQTNPKSDDTTMLRTTDEPEMTAEETVKPNVKVASVVVVNKTVANIRKVHNIRPIKKFENLQRMRSASNAKQRPVGVKVGTKATSLPKQEAKESISDLLSNLHQKILTGVETDSLIRKTLRQGDTPMVAITLRKPFK